ncbi:MAG: 3-oxoacyl-ACP reductase FabG [Butyrivibrio sp.]|nr:3-oxoacyl-ACP reductase FabG [Butyrivibrio sp.]
MNRKVLITGASRGIGREIAISFARSGDELYLTCRDNLEMLEELGNWLVANFGVTCRACQCDVSNYNAVKELFDAIGDIDILINNAGIAWMGLLQDMEEEDWHRVIGTNLDGCFNTCKFAVPGMVRNQMGLIINISSVWGNVGASYEVAYSASKGGVNSFTRALAKELAPSNVQVNAIACGVIDTDMNRNHLSQEELENLSQEIPAGRMGNPSEVAETVMMLVEAPTYLTGQIITLDGGWI